MYIDANALIDETIGGGYGWRSHHVNNVTTRRGWGNQHQAEYIWRKSFAAAFMYIVKNGGVSD